MHTKLEFVLSVDCGFCTGILQGESLWAEMSSH